MPSKATSSRVLGIRMCTPLRGWGRGVNQTTWLVHLYSFFLSERMGMELLLRRSQEGEIGASEEEGMALRGDFYFPCCVVTPAPFLFVLFTSITLNPEVMGYFVFFFRHFCYKNSNLTSVFKNCGSSVK